MKCKMPVEEVDNQPLSDDTDQGDAWQGEWTWAILTMKAERTVPNEEYSTR